MAIAYANHKANGSAAGGTSIVVTVPASGYALNSLVALGCASADNTFNVSSITDSKSNPYTVHSTTRVTFGGTAALICSGVLSTGALASGDTITLTLATSTGGAVQSAEFTGVSTSSPFDVGAAASIPFDSNFSSGNTAATAQADELLFGMNFANSAARSFTAAGSFNEIDDTAFFGAWDQQIQYRVVSATGAYASTATADTTTTGLAMIATFKASLGVDTGLAWIKA